MSGELVFNWDNLPSICQSDQDIEILLDDIFELKLYRDKYYEDDSCPNNYKKLFKPNHELDLLSDFRNNRENLYNELSKLNNDATKKQVAKAFDEQADNFANSSRIAILIYLSGLWQLEITSTTGKCWDWYQLKAADIKISNQGDYFLELPRTDLYTSFIIKTDKHCYIEPIIFCDCIESLKFDSQNSENLTYFSKIKFRGIELLPCNMNQTCIHWYGDEKESFNLKNLTLEVDEEGNVYTTGADFENFQLKTSNMREKTINLKDHSSALLLSDSIPSLSVENSHFSKIEFQNCKFKSIPNFDDKSTVKHSVDINKATFDNLLKVKQSGSLEFSRLAEFFNRNNAYMEGQQLHRHYLLAKAKESKSRGLKAWVWFYDTINGCGTSLLKPFLFLVLLFSISCNIYFYLTNIIGADIFYKAIDNLLPFSGVFTTNHDIINLVVILALKITSIFSTLLWFLMALQIRKLLKLKE
ncbi:hypothetical protein QIW49_05355 [Francisellaceae bacterium CB300]